MANIFDCRSPIQRRARPRELLNMQIYDDETLARTQAAAWRRYQAKQFDPPAKVQVARRQVKLASYGKELWVAVMYRETKA